tara:strand:+ start:873 stop:1421 length:549 start_codon:yes stop_codon:yes gene_type:complete
MGSYKFRVLLDNPNNEEIFRDIKISSENTFSEFYDIIIDSFYFKGDQLASFYASNNSWDKGREISLMDMDTADGSESPLTMNDTVLKDLITSDNQKFILVYDFLKMWCFLIELVGVSTESIEAPSIEISIGISPREDSREVDLGDSLAESSQELGSDFDDIFNEFEDEDDFGGFENIDDFDI